MKHRVPSLLSVLLMAPLLLVACNGEAGPLDPAPAVGAYTLYQINRATPPLIVDEVATGQVEVLGGSLTLRSDRSYTETGDVRIVPRGGPPGAPQTNSVSGSFRLILQNGVQRVEFRTQRGELSFGTLTGDTITYAVPGFTVSYVR
jgi:hypothetical protein